MKLIAFLLQSFSVPSWKSNVISHLNLSKLIWKDYLKVGNHVIDATVGNGFDSLAIAPLILSSSSGKLYCIDIQESAIDKTKERLQKKLPVDLYQRVEFYCQSHSTFPATIPSESVDMICYNLGYLPGKPRKNNSTPDFPQDQNIATLEEPIITRASSTLQSIEHGMKLLKSNGLFSITAYPGHKYGDQETDAVKSFLSSLSPLEWKVYSHCSLNREKSPQLFLAYKLKPTSKEDHPE